MEKLIEKKHQVQLFLTEKDEPSKEILNLLIKRSSSGLLSLNKVFIVSLRFGNSEEFPQIPGLIEALKLARENVESPVLLFGSWIDWEIEKETKELFHEFIHRVNTGYLLEPFDLYSFEKVLERISQKMFD